MVTFATVHETGTISTGMHFGVAELITDRLSERIKGEPIDSGDFWRWSAQILQGVADIHRSGVLHLDLQVKHLFLSTRGVC